MRLGTRTRALLLMAVGATMLVSAAGGALAAPAGPGETVPGPVVVTPYNPSSPSYSMIQNGTYFGYHFYLRPSPAGSEFRVYVGPGRGLGYGCTFAPDTAVAPTRIENGYYHSFLGKVEIDGTLTCVNEGVVLSFRYRLTLTFDGASALKEEFKPLGQASGTGSVGAVASAS